MKKIKVVFKKRGEDAINVADKRYLFKDELETNVGDIVAVNTVNGLAFATVVEIDVVDTRFNEDQLATVQAIVKANKIFIEEDNRRKQIEVLQRKIRRNFLLKKISDLVEGEDLEVLNQMTEKELENFFNDLQK